MISIGAIPTHVLQIGVYILSQELGHFSFVSLYNKILNFHNNHLVRVFQETATFFSSKIFEVHKMKRKQLCILLKLSPWKLISIEKNKFISGRNKAEFQKLWFRFINTSLNSGLRNCHKIFMVIKQF